MLRHDRRRGSMFHGLDARQNSINGSNINELGARKMVEKKAVEHKKKGVAMTEQSEYTTRATYLGGRYGCRVLRGGRVVVEGQCQTRDQIGATFRDLFRTLDKLGGDAFTSAARKRKYREGNAVASVKHLWGGWGGRAQQAHR